MGGTHGHRHVPTLASALVQGFQEATGAPLVCLTNSGGIRADLAPGAVTYGDVTAVLPFGNFIEVLSITGADLKAALAFGFDSVRPHPLLSRCLQQCRNLLPSGKKGTLRDVPVCLAEGFVGFVADRASTRLPRQRRRRTRRSAAVRCWGPHCRALTVLDRAPPGQACRPTRKLQARPQFHLARWHLHRCEFQGRLRQSWFGGVHGGTGAFAEAGSTRTAAVSGTPAAPQRAC